MCVCVCMYTLPNMDSTVIDTHIFSMLVCVCLMRVCMYKDIRCMHV
jgi:hypothetical protein